MKTFKKYLIGTGVAALAAGSGYLLVRRQRQHRQEKNRTPTEY